MVAAYRQSWVMISGINFSAVVRVPKIAMLISTACEDCDSV
ncbi:hypothetical protein D088_470017 [Salmonella enterica subsp. houtenae serovar 16:z4,z32:-- str. RKS3027]|nr:hypothetical protein D088_470017 [Salmonella enterica subsp. houtenae serovar 16:z4,z32:-- str. RKS3027]